MAMCHVVLEPVRVLVPLLTTRTETGMWPVNVNRGNLLVSINRRNLLVPMEGMVLEAIAILVGLPTPAHGTNKWSVPGCGISGEGGRKAMPTMGQPRGLGRDWAQVRRRDRTSRIRIKSGGFARSQGTAIPVPHRRSQHRDPTRIMHLFKVLQESMQVGQIQPATDKV